MSGKKKVSLLGASLLSLGSLIVGCDSNDGGKDETSDPQPELRVLDFGEAGSLRYEIINGQAVYQGDILLGEADEVAEHYQEVYGRPPAELEPGAGGVRNVEQNLIAVEGNPCPALDFFTLGRVFNDRWDDEIPYEISSDYSSEERAQVRATMGDVIAHYADKTGLTFVEHSDEGAYLLLRDFRPGDNPGGRACGRSSLGKTGGRQNVFFVPDGSVGCLIHEIGHAIGMAHEQARSDRNQYVEIQRENIASGRGHNFDKEMECAFSDVGEYDYESVMHYSAWGFIADGRTCNEEDTSGCTIVPADESVSIFDLGSNRLSDGDIRGLCDIYGNPAFARFFDTEDEIVSEDDTTVFSDGAVPQMNVEYQWRGLVVPTPMTVTSDIDGEVASFNLPAGQDPHPVNLPDLSAGTHQLTFSFPEHCPVSETRQIEVEPFFELVSPPDGSGYSKGAPIPFQASVGGLGTSGSLTWESDLDGAIEADSPEFFSARLSEGTHTLTATAEFADGTELSDSVSIEVINQAPQVTLVSPDDGESFCVDENVSLRALTQDLDLEDIPDESVQWSFTGTNLGTGHSLDHTFTEADTGSLMVSAVDASGGEGTDQIDLTIDPCTTSPPVISTDWPEGDLSITGSEDAHFMYDNGLAKELTLSVTATDAEDGALTGSSIEWTTDRTDLQDGSLGTGETVDVSLLAENCFGSVHVIEVTATDSDGLSRSQTFVVRISGGLC